MEGHSILAPHAAPQWGECSGSLKAQKDFPNLETVETRNGTAAHWVASETLERIKEGIVTDCYALLGCEAPNGVIIDEEIVEGAQIFVDDVICVLSEMEDKVGHSVHSRLMVEQRVKAPFIHPELWGTLDCAIYILELDKIFIWDYKHGHVQQDAVNNWQLASYIGGVVDAFALWGSWNTKIHARIVQPYCYANKNGPVCEWTTNSTEMRAVFNRLSNQANEALGGKPKLKTGKHCTYCRAVGTCSAARQMGYNLISVVNAPYEMDDMTPHDLAVERRLLRDALEPAKSRLQAIEDTLEQKIKEGDTTSGLTLESSLGSLEWSVPVPQAIAFAAQFNVKISVDKILTPTQTKAEVSKELRPFLAQAMKAVTRNKLGTLKLVEIENSKHAKAFKKRK